MRKTLSTVLALGFAIALAGCPRRSGKKPAVDAPPAPRLADPVADAKPAEPKAVDIAHVRVGQKYHFRMAPAPAMQMDMVWEVTAITASEVKYTMTSSMHGKTVGPVTPGRWAIPVPTEGAPDVKPRVEELITLAGRDWVCEVQESDGVRRWVPMKGGVKTFPPCVKETKDGRVTNELTHIE